MIMRANEEMIDWEIIKPIINELVEASINTDLVRIRELLVQIVPDFNPNFHVID